MPSLKTAFIKLKCFLSSNYSFQKVGIKLEKDFDSAQPDIEILTAASIKSVTLSGVEEH